MSLELIQFVTENSNYSSGTSCQTSYSVGGGHFRRLTLIGAAISSGVNYGAVNVSHEGVSGFPNPIKFVEGDVWQDGGSMIGVYIWYILDADLPTIGTKAVTVTTGDVADIALFAAMFENVDQEAPRISTSRVVANGVSENTIAIENTLNTDLIFTVGAGQEGTQGDGLGQVILGSYPTGSYYHKASYELTPDVPSDYQMLNIKGDSVMSTTVFGKALAVVSGRTYIIG